MPKITSYNVEWLSQPHPGHQLFTPTPSSSIAYNGATNGRGRDDEETGGPRRKIARRGTEIFVAVGKEVRWADLAYLKNKLDREKTGERYEQDREGFAQGHRTLTTRVADEIQQLIISPRDDYLAILTKHTVHIGIIPSSSHLTGKIDDGFKFKTFTLGPTTHVTTQAAVASAIWHPLGVAGMCLVTVTTDANVRVWELSLTDRWSFDRPTLSINLSKLADGVSQEQDFSVSDVSLNRSVAFSPDSFEMEVASACFASKESGGWSSMTLWVAMREGDVYALCPLLPERWSPHPDLVPSLSTSVIAQIASIEDDHQVSHRQKQLGQQQLAWMSDVDAQEPQFVDGLDGGKEEVYYRPAKPGKVPKLQGPFEFDLAPPDNDEDELNGMLTDIYAIGPKLDLGLGEFDEDDYSYDSQGLSVGILCLTSRNGRLSILLDVAGVEAQWLPRTRPRNNYHDEGDDYPSLLTFQVMDTVRAEEMSPSNWPVFSSSLDSSYSFYVTNTSNTLLISLQPWISRLETELSGGAAGTQFRIDMLSKNQSSIREEIHRQKMVDHTNPLSAAVSICDPDLGDLVLTCTAHGPITVVFEPPYEGSDDMLGRSFTRSPTHDNELDIPLTLYEPRPIYQPSYTLSTPSELPAFLDATKLRHAQLFSSAVRLSPTTLTTLTDAHKILSEETHRLGEAAAEIFRRIEVLQAELKSKVEKANEIASRVDEITGNVSDTDGSVQDSEERYIQRIQAARKTQTELAQRVDRLKRKAARGSQRPLSDREKAWFEEVSSFSSKILPPGEPTSSVKEKDPFASLSTSLAQTSLTPQPYERYDEAKTLADDLLGQAQELTDGADSGRSSVMSGTGMLSGRSRTRVSQAVRNQEIEDIKARLERQSEIVERTKERLEGLMGRMD